MQLNRREALQNLAVGGVAALGLRKAPSVTELCGPFTDYAARTIPHMDVSVRHTAQGPEVHYASGRTVYVEGLVGGRWVTKFWSATGAAPAGVAWRIADAFAIGIKTKPTPPQQPGTKVVSGWQWVSGREVPGAKAGATVFAVELENPAQALRVRLLTLLDGTPVLTRWLEITNLADHANALTELCPWSGRLWEGDVGEAVKLGHPTRWLPQWAGWLQWSPLQPGKTVLEQTHGLTYQKPYFLLQHTRRGEYIFAQMGWPVNFRIAFDRGAGGLTFQMGPAAYHALRVLAAGETVTTPATHLAYLQGTFDAAVQAMQAHVRRSVVPSLNPQRAYRSQYLLPGDQPLSVCKGAAFDETNVKKCIDVAAAAGLEVFILDALWTGTYGDWLKPDARRFPHGLSPVRKYAHQKGMLFGLYFELEGGRRGYSAFGASIGGWAESAVYQQHPDWFIEPQKIVNLTIPAAAEYFNQTLNQVIDFYRLDLYRHDFNAPLLGDGPSTLRHGFLECDYWRQYEVFYDAFHRARRRHPELILQQASAGGTRLDLATAGAFNENYVTDDASCPSGYEILNGVSTCLPSETLVFPNGMSGSNQPDYETILRATYALGNTPMLFNGMLPESLEKMSAEVRRKLLHYATFYKRFIRPLLATCLVYHHAPINATGGVDSGDWLALEFVAPDRRHGWAIFIQLNAAGPSTCHFAPAGLDPRLTYRVTSDNTGRRQLLRGAALTREGLTISATAAVRSELLFFAA